MAYTLRRATGEVLNPDGSRLTFGFAGHSAGLNNPLLENQRSLGPMPAARYRMTAFREKDEHMGACVILLEPEPGSEMHGRAGFAWHGWADLSKYGWDKFSKSSDGCLCAGDCALRRAVWASGDHLLDVI